MELITDKGVIEIINMTPHKITVVNNEGEVVFELSGTDSPPRVQERKNDTEIWSISGTDEIEVHTAKNVNVKGIPAKKENTYYIVSRLVAEYANRSDLLVPDEFVRDEDGTIVACKSFKKIKKSE